MTILQIKCFLTLSETLNFTKAAAQLFIMQPYLSKQIATLEQELGFRLFHRDRRNVQLTQEGLVLAEELKSVPNLVDSAIEKAKAATHGRTGMLCLGILDGQELNLSMISRLRQFQTNYPNIILNMERYSFSALRNGIKTGHFDAVITLGFDVETDPEFDFRIILKQHAAAAIHRSNPFSEKENLTLSDLADQKFVLLTESESPAAYKRFMEECAKLNFVPKIARYLTSLENLFLSVETGEGIALLDRNTRLENNSNIRLVDIPESQNTNVAVAWRKNDSNPVLQTFISSLAD
ncbi:MAG: LysR family transcriptional regulator [Bacillota bacterium]